jgi:Protein of unknown function (DUF2442)
MLWVTDAKYLGGYRLWLSFNDGLSGEVDLLHRLHGEIFEPLQDVNLFEQVRFEPDMDTIVWPNGANLAPEYLHEQIVQRGSHAAYQPIPAHLDDQSLRVTGAEYLGEYRVWLQFSDGTSGEADLSAALWGSVFEPLKDKAFFSLVKFAPEMDTIVWPNGADLAPEYLKDLVVQQAALAVQTS